MLQWTPLFSTLTSLCVQSTRLIYRPSNGPEVQLLLAFLLWIDIYIAVFHLALLQQHPLNTAHAGEFPSRAGTDLEWLGTRKQAFIIWIDSMVAFPTMIPTGSRPHVGNGL